MSARYSTLVIGAAIGYDEGQVAPFLKSLRKAGYGGDVALLVTADLARRARLNPLFSGVTFIRVRQWFPYRWHLTFGSPGWRYLWRPQQRVLWHLVRMLGKLPSPAALRLWLRCEVCLRLVPPSEARYLHYRRFIAANPYRRVLITDVRDVLFQSDPFRHLPESGLAVSMEARSYVLADEIHNSNWVRGLYGEEMLKRIGTHSVSCSGVTSGDRRSILEYLDLMQTQILGIGYAASTRALGGYDQGVHNVLLRTGQLGPCAELNTLHSPIATLAGMRAEEIRLSPGGRLLNHDGSLPSIVHQYDRFPHLQWSLPERLC